MTDPGHITAGVWRHWKGPHYLVLGIAADSNNTDPHGEPQVVYVSLEGYGLEGPRLRFRGVREFLDRFSLVEGDESEPTQTQSPGTSS